MEKKIKKSDGCEGQLVMKQKQSGIEQSKWRKEGSGEESGGSQELDVRFERSLV